jgi:ABC-type branched-subunit amino acid transport system ATPase component
VLEVQRLSVAYGGVQALDGVDLSIRAAQLVGLIGPNGAGKTTFIEAVCGFTPATGSVVLDGVPVSALPAHRRARLGLVRTFQSVELFDDLDVRGNLLVAAAGRPVWWHRYVDLVRPGRPSAMGALERAAELTGIVHLLDRATTELSEGERKLVGVARALTGAPRMLLLDEPAAGLDSVESRALGACLLAIVAAGTTVLLVDHDMDLVLNVCDEVHVLERGRLLTSGTPDAIRRDDRVVAAYLGASR